MSEIAMHNGKALFPCHKHQQTLSFFQRQGYENIHELLNVRIFLSKPSTEVD